MELKLRKGSVFAEPPYTAPAEVAAWLAGHMGQVFKLDGKDGVIRMHAIGAEADACREPINITAKAPRPLNLISNFAQTPFKLDGRGYASIEGFWQGLKFPQEADRTRLAALSGSQAKDAGAAAPASDLIVYEDELIRVGTWDHWQLIEQACFAKFSQHAGARTALLGTGARPLVHEIGQGSKTIPGVIMAGIWMELRTRMGGVTGR